jgi:hypothetical protein
VIFSIQRLTARAANTMIRCASVESRSRWQIKPMLGDYPLTHHQRWYVPLHLLASLAMQMSVQNLLERGVGRGDLLFGGQRPRRPGRGLGRV